MKRRGPWVRLTDPADGIFKFQTAGTLFWETIRFN